MESRPFSTGNLVVGKARIPVFILATVGLGVLFCWFLETPSAWALIANPLHLQPLQVPTLTALCFVALSLGLRILLPRVAFLAWPLAAVLVLFGFAAPPFMDRVVENALRLGVLALVAAIPFLAASKVLLPLATPAFDKHSHIPTLDGWRAVAILVVIADHANYGSKAVGGWFTDSAFQGQHGVNIFFVLSGFLITSRLLEELDQTGRVSLAEFYYRRIFRILPAAYSFLLIVAILGLSHYLFMNYEGLAACVLFTANLYFHPLLIDHYWSLALEEQFYLLLPLTLLSTTRKNFLRITGPLCALIGAWRWWRLYSSTVWPDTYFETRFRTDLRIDVLIYGAILAVCFQNERFRDTLRKILHPVSWLGLLVFLCYWCRVPDAYTTVPECLAITLLIAGTVLRPKAWAGQLLELPSMRWIGHISYGLYLWQQFFCFGWRDSYSWFQRFPYNLIFTFGVAILSYYAMEKPLLRWSRKRWNQQAEAPCTLLKG